MGRPMCSILAAHARMLARYSPVNSRSRLARAARISCRVWVWASVLPSCESAPINVPIRV